MSEAEVYGSVDSPQGKYFKLKDGEEARVRIYSDSSTALIYERVFTDKKTGEINMSVRFAYVVWNYKAGLAQVWVDISGATYDKIKKLIMNKEYGDVTKYDVTVSREGEQLQTKYDVIAARENTDLPGVAVNACGQIDLRKEVERGDGVQHVMTLFDFHEAKNKSDSEDKLDKNAVY